ncbi:MAG: DMT family transporter [Alphaproteobacteria bacterium]|nr:DMT family transporter [Alphaproteobacteria bacterium]
MAQASPMRMTPVEWLLLVILGLCWGCTFFFNEIAVLEVPPLVIILVRVSLATAILWVAVLASGAMVPRDRDIWIALLVMGAINSSVPFFLIAWGQVHITGGLASILIATSPLFAVIAAHFFTTDEGFTLGKVLGVMAGLVGVVFLIGPELLGEIGSDLLGQLSILGAAFLYAISAIYGRRFAARGVAPIVVATGQMTMAVVLVLPVALIIEQPWTMQNPGLSAWGAMIGLAVISTSFAYLIYFRILATAGAINILLVNFLVPVSALLLGIFILGETLSIEQMIGMACIALGLALIDGRVVQRLRG